MSVLQQLEEKQLFEKFWKGTFKAVATPRPESVIVASITARRRVTDPSFDEDLSPRPTPKGKKKKRKSERKRKRKSCSLFVCLQMLSSKPGDELLHGKGTHHHTLSSQIKGPHDYDSGNDTSSPPSSKTGVSRASVSEDKRNHCQGLTSPEKLKFTDRDNVSDSGNSVTSYASLCKPHVEDGLSPGRPAAGVGASPLGVRDTLDATLAAHRCHLAGWLTALLLYCIDSSNTQCGYWRFFSRFKRVIVFFFFIISSYSRSPSYSADLRRRGSVASASSRGSYSRYSPDRERDVKHTQKNSGKRRRRKSFSPMKKRRRDSPSHLEARRITSARKRPIPYFRPSPSSSSRSTSVSSWSSLFTRSRSRSPVHSISRSRSRSRSRSHSYSSYRSYSRSSSWNSIFGTRSRSRSRSSILQRNEVPFMFPVES
uniref:Serine/arginine repetitive matrix 4 n=1 Tax=Myripristis murdjan TaxID=586833 RepID=A0A667ZXJ6_9TELE